MDPSIPRFLVEAAVIWCQNRQMEVTIPFLPCRSKIVNISSVTAVEGLGGIQQRTHNTLARSLARSLPSSPRLVLLIEESRGRGRGEREERERERERWRLCDSPNAMLACSLPSHHACTPYPYAVSIRATAVALVVVVIVVVFPVISGLPSRP